MSNEMFQLFKAIAAKHGIPTTSRQWRKWLRGEGAVFAAAKLEASHNRKLRAMILEIEAVR